LAGAFTVPVCYLATLVVCILIIYQIKKRNLSSREPIKVDSKQDIFVHTPRTVIENSFDEECQMKEPTSASLPDEVEINETKKARQEARTSRIKIGILLFMLVLQFVFIKSELPKLASDSHAIQKELDKLVVGTEVLRQHTTKAADSLEDLMFTSQCFHNLNIENYFTNILENLSDLSPHIEGFSNHIKYYSSSIPNSIRNFAAAYESLMGMIWLGLFLTCFLCSFVSLGIIAYAMNNKLKGPSSLGVELYACMSLIALSFYMLSSFLSALPTVASDVCIDPNEKIISIVYESSGNASAELLSTILKDVHTCDLTSLMNGNKEHSIYSIGLEQIINTPSTLGKVDISQERSACEYIGNSSDSTFEIDLLERQINRFTNDIVNLGRTLNITYSESICPVYLASRHYLCNDLTNHLFFDSLWTITFVLTICFFLLYR